MNNKMSLKNLDAINDFDGGIRQVSGSLGTAAIFATFPKPYLSVIGGCIDLVYFYD